MNNIHPNTLLFFEKIKNIVLECQKRANVCIIRHQANRNKSRDEFDIYSTYKEKEFNEGFNYYIDENCVNSSKINSLIRYHIINEPIPHNDISQQFVDDLMNAFLNDNVSFQLVIQYFGNKEFEWSDALFESNMPEEDMNKLFYILGPSKKFHEMIKYYYNKPQFYPLILDCFTHYGYESRNANLFYEDILKCFLNNEYIDKKERHKYVDLAVKYIGNYVKRFCLDDEYEQLNVFNVIRKITPNNEWIKFKKCLPIIKFNKTVKSQKIIFSDIPIFIKKINLDITSISKSHPYFILERDVSLILYWLQQYINSDSSNLIGIKKMSKAEGFIYLESNNPIDSELFIFVIKELFKEIGNFNLEEFKKVIELFDNKQDWEYKKQIDFIKKYIPKIVLDSTLKYNIDKKKKISKV